MHELSGPAAGQHSPVLAGAKPPRVARPLRAAGLTPAARRAGVAIVAGLTEEKEEEKDSAIPLAISEANGVLYLLRDRGRTKWDRCGIVRGFWASRTIGSWRWDGGMMGGSSSRSIVAEFDGSSIRGAGDARAVSAT